MVKNSNPREKFVKWKEDQRSALMHSLNVNTKQTFTRFFAKKQQQNRFQTAIPRIFGGSRSADFESTGLGCTFNISTRKVNDSSSS